MPTFLVGDGHGGSEDYATCDLCYAAESQTDDGNPLIMECLGDVGRFSPTGPSINGVIIRTQGVTYDGSNQSSLAQGDRFDFNATSANALAPIVVHDMYIDNRGQAFTRAVDVNVDFVTLFNLRVISLAANAPGLGVTVQCPNSSLSTSVISGGPDVVSWGFQDGMNIENVLIFGGGDKGLEASSSLAFEIKDSFSTGNGGSDLDTGTVTITTCATGDTTGTFTGYTTAELVDFASDDFRTKSISPLATLGTGGSFIGAFLESGGPTGVSITTTEVLNSFSDSVTADISINVQLSVTESLQSFVDVANVNITPNVVIDVNVTETLNSYDDLSQVQIVEAGQVGVSVTEILNSFEDSSIAYVSANVAAAVTESLNSFSDSSNAIIQKEIKAQVTEQLSSFMDSANIKLPTKWVDQTPPTANWTVKTKVNTIWKDL